MTLKKNGVIIMIEKTLIYQMMSLQIPLLLFLYEITWPIAPKLAQSFWMKAFVIALRQELMKREEHEAHRKINVNNTGTVE